MLDMAHETDSATAGLAKLDTQQRCRIRRAVRQVAEAPADVIRQTVEAQARFYGVSVGAVAAVLAR